MRQARLAALATSALILAAPLLSAHADTDGDTRQGIQAAYAKRDAALNRFDIEGYLAAYNGNYKNVTEGGKPGTTDKQRQGVIAQFQHSQNLIRHETVQSVTPYGDGVTVMTTAITARTAVNSKTGKVTHIVDTDHDRAFWVNTKSGWRIKQERTLSRVETQNGQPTSA